VADRQRVVAMLASLRAALADLERYEATVDVPTFERDRDTRNMVLHALYEAAQAAIDLAMHIVADEALRPASTYREAFESLRDGGWVDTEMCRSLSGWAGLRNIIAHGYLRLDPALVIAAIADRDALARFASLVARSLVTDPS